jgi:hypothetical protein
MIVRKLQPKPSPAPSPKPNTHPVMYGCNTSVMIAHGNTHMMISHANTHIKESEGMIHMVDAAHGNTHVKISHGNTYIVIGNTHITIGNTHTIHTGNIHRLKATTNVVPPGAVIPGVLPPLPSVVINERTLIFRMDSRTLWTRYALGMINYSVSDFGGMPSTPQVESNLSRNAAAVGNYFVPYYGLTAGTKIGDLLAVLVRNGTKIVQAIKARGDYDVYKEIWFREIDSLVNYLNEINPSQYPKDLLKEMFINLTNFWVEDFEARFNQDFAADAIALDNILKVAVIGIPDHANKGYSSIADILSRGIISQFPLSFVE